MTTPLSLALLIALSGTAWAPAPDPRVAAIAPFVGEDVAVVVHLDLSKLDVAPLARRVLGGFARADEVDQASQIIDRRIAALRRAGATDLFVLVDPADIPGPPIAVVPLAEGADAQALGRVLCGGGDERPPYSWPTCATVHGAVFAGSAAALERVRHQKPASRPELGAAFAASGETPARVLILPGADQRRVIEENLPNLPREFGGGPITIVTRGLIWAAIALEPEPRPTVRVVIQSQDQDAAQTLRRSFQDALRRNAPFPDQPLPDDLAKALAQLKPEVVDDRVVLDIDLDRASALVGAPFRAARAATGRARCSDNLKQIGVAIAIYHSSRQTFPPAYTRDKEGRPLLSWRVHLLPFLEQQSLYNEFHLDEPWDSPHNKALIARIPPTYICPNASRKLGASGRTTYLVPRGKATIFPGGEPVKINEVTDGMSYTILVVDVADDRAVIWTKPDDWDVDPEPAKDQLFDHHPGGTNATFADGSVRFLKATIRPAVLRHLTTRNGGEVLKPEDF